MRRILVIRFGSLGDVCLLCRSLAELAAAAGDGRPHVTVATKAAFAPLLAAAPGVDAVEPLAGPGLGHLLALARRLRRTRFAAIVDAHGVLRSRLLLAMMGRRAQRRLAKDTLARLWLLRARRVHPALARTMRDRFADALAGLAPGSGAGAVATAATAVAAAAGATAAADRAAAAKAAADDAAAGAAAVVHPLRPPAVPAGTARLGLAPGARWDAKRWPEENYAELLRGFRARTGLPVTIFLGPREAAWFPGGALARAAAELDGVDVCSDLPLPRLAAELAACRAVVTNDSGLLHLAEAAGTPVLALFGPTVRAFGYYPCLPDSRVLERDLECRPCSRNGRRPCWRGDLACLAALEPAAALAALLAMPVWADLAGKDAPHG